MIVRRPGTRCVSPLTTRAGPSPPRAPRYASMNSSPRSVKRHDPTPTSVKVRSPAGLPAALCSTRSTRHHPREEQAKDRFDQRRGVRHPPSIPRTRIVADTPRRNTVAPQTAAVAQLVRAPGCGPGVAVRIPSVALHSSIPTHPTRPRRSLCFSRPRRPRRGRELDGVHRSTSRRRGSGAGRMSPRHHHILFPNRRAGSTASSRSSSTDRTALRVAEHARHAAAGRVEHPSATSGAGAACSRRRRRPSDGSARAARRASPAAPMRMSGAGRPHRCSTKSSTSMAFFARARQRLRRRSFSCASRRPSRSGTTADDEDRGDRIVLDEGATARASGPRRDRVGQQPQRDHRPSRSSPSGEA